jgi:hypothetical protein
MATARSWAIDFMLLNHDEDLIERLQLSVREDPAVAKVNTLDMKPLIPGATKYPVASKTSVSRERVAASHHI